MTVMLKIVRSDFTDEAWQRLVESGRVAEWEAKGLVDYDAPPTPLGPSWADIAARRKNLPPAA